LEIQLEKAIEKHKKFKRYLEAELGTDRFNSAVSEITRIIKQNDLSPVELEGLFNHLLESLLFGELSDIFQVKRKHV
jgi:thiamine biosynthesis lipoprotein ApbE